MPEDHDLTESKLVIDINRDLKLRFRAKATIQDRTMTDLVIQWVENYVKNFNPNL